MCERGVINAKKYELKKDIFLPCMTGYGENRSTRLPVVVRHIGDEMRWCPSLSPSGHYLLGYLMNRAEEEEGRKLKWATTTTTSCHRRIREVVFASTGCHKKEQFCEKTSIFLVACMGCPLLFLTKPFVSNFVPRSGARLLCSVPFSPLPALRCSKKHRESCPG